MDLVLVTDSPEEAVRTVVDCYEQNCSLSGRPSRRRRHDEKPAGESRADQDPASPSNTPAEPSKGDAQ
jgi:hypothetical protein